MQHVAAGYRWLLAGLIAVFLLLLAGSIFFAAKKVSRVTDPDYYRHGLEHDRHLTSPANSWQLAAERVRDGVRVSVVDQAGRPAPADSVQFIRDTSGSRSAPFRVQLARQADGTFLLPLAEPHDALRGTLVATGDAGQASRRVLLLP